MIAQDANGQLPVPDDAALWADGLALTFPVLADVDGEFYPIWDPDGVLPVAYIIDPDGVVIWAEAGGAGGLDEIEAVLQSQFAE